MSDEQLEQVTPDMTVREIGAWQDQRKSLT